MTILKLFYRHVRKLKIIYTSAKCIYILHIQALSLNFFFNHRYLLIILFKIHINFIINKCHNYLMIKSCSISVKSAVCKFLRKYAETYFNFYTNISSNLIMH